MFRRVATGDWKSQPGELCEGRVIDRTQAQIYRRRMGLKPPSGAWHYSMNVDLWPDQFFCHERLGKCYLYGLTSLNEWSPAPFFTNDSKINFVLGDSSHNKPFWHLKLEGLDGFLARRELLSSNPKKNFPSIKTYAKRQEKLDCELVNEKLFHNTSWFKEVYTRIKHEKYSQDGKSCIDTALKTNPGVPGEWFEFYVLQHRMTGEEKAIALLISDDRSSSLINIASLRRGGAGYGTYLLTALVDDLSKRRKKHFDAGISGIYGHYKNLIFLDSLKVTDPGSFGALLHNSEP